MKILRHLNGGCPNIVSLFEVTRDPDTKTPCFIFELVEATSFKDLQNLCSDFDVRNYMYQLLKALDYCHSQGIMHRDVKVIRSSAPPLPLLTHPTLLPDSLVTSSSTTPRNSSSSSIGV